MSEYNKSTFKAQKDIYFQNNTNELIKALTMRTFGDDVADSVAWRLDNEIIPGNWTFSGTTTIGDATIKGVSIDSAHLPATMIASPTDGHIPYWDNGNSRLDFDSFANLLTAADVTGFQNLSFASTKTIHIPSAPTSTTEGAAKFSGGNLQIYYEGSYQTVGTVNEDSTVYKAGTPTAGQVAMWTGADTIEGVDNVVFLEEDPNKWMSLGNSLTISGIGIPSLTALSATRIAFIDGTNSDLRTYDFDGTDWSQVGNDLNISGIGFTPKLTALSATRVAFIDDSNDDLRTYDFDGTDWSQVGNDLNISSVGTLSITALSSTRIAFIDNTNDDLRTYDFDGTDWSQVGNDLNISGIGTPSITALSSTRIAFIDSTNDDLRTYDFDGTDWSQVGNDLNISSVGSPRVTALSSTRIAFIDSTNDDLRTYDFDGTDWSQVGNDLNISSVGEPSITALSSTRIAFIDNTNGELKTYSLDFTNRLAFWTDETTVADTTAIQIDANENVSITNDLDVLNDLTVINDLDVNGDATFGSDSSGNLAVTIANATISDNDERVYNLVATHNSNTRGTAIGIYTHSGITNACSFISLDPEDGTNNYFWSDNSDVFRVSTSKANVGTTGGTVVGTQTSDERVKDIDKNPFPYGLDEVVDMAKSAIRFALKYDTENKKRLGFPAQALQKIIPEMVYETNETKIMPDGEEIENVLGVDDRHLSPVFAVAIAQLKSEIDEIKSQLNN